MQNNFGLKIGDICVLKEHPDYCFARILRFVKVNNYVCAECAYSQKIDDTIYLVKTFKLRDLKRRSNG